ncbi:MAG: penicillin-binding transpeptidase domain-containing protein [Acutalibacteraceae bacterium]|nr:penicillin-binding transpeptidase domain-containing protein [Acutalibacteraceae bacterium]
MNKRKIRKRSMYAVALLFVFLISLFVFRFFKNGENWAFYQTNPHIYKSGQLSNAGKITDRDDVLISDTQDSVRVYNENSDIRKATIHVAGDHEGFVSTGVTNSWRDKLVGYSVINGVYTQSGKGNDAELTISSQLSIAAMKALGDSAGCVGVCNYKTGEVLCMVSTPTYDIMDIKQYEKAKNGELGSVFVNRFISSSYTPGSTFKIVTAAAAIETLGQQAYSNTQLCNYGTVIEGETLSCMGKHKTVSLERAFSHSCNSFFSNTALSLGKSTMTRYAEMMGFNKTFYIDNIACAKSSYNVKDARNIDFGWSGIGQYTNLMNPVQYLCMVSAIANGGEYKEPYFVHCIRNSSGKITYKAQPKTVRMISGETAEKLALLMDFAVSDNYGKATFGTLDVCGKTGTAEVGDNKENSLFIGFCKDENLPLAFVVVAEGGGSGRKSAMSIANKTLQSAKKVLIK